MSDDQRTPVQASGDKAKRVAPDGVSETGTHGKRGGGESQGGGYPNPHAGKSDKERKHGFGSHGGQTEIGYHGTGQLGEQKTLPDGNPNAGARKG